MSTANKYMQSASGVGGAAPDVDDVFSTYLYEGNGSTQTITNNVDLSGEGGLVWIKSRAWSYPHGLFDTERGATKQLKSSSTVAERTLSTLLTSFNNNGFSLGSDSDVNGTYSTAKYASWTFRKAEKFFDVVTYTGNGTNGRAIAHNLSSNVGSVIIKRLDATEAWYVWHKGYPSGSLKLNEDSAGLSFGLNQYFGGTQPTSSNFYVSSDSGVNNNGSAYVAYLFAHNNGDGEFGPDADQDIIKCGSYTGNGSSQHIDLGFEPQWVLLKRTDGSDGTFDFWHLTDSMRGMPVLDSTSAAPVLLTNGSDAESTGYSNIRATANGFAFTQGNSGENINGHTYIYIAIRRGPLAPPESATEVFDIKTSVNTNPAFTSDNVIDLAMFTHKTSSDNRYWSARLASRGYLYSNATNAEATNQPTFDFGDTQFGHYNATGLGTNYLGYFWKRAPNYFDVVAWKVDGTGDQTINHNLGVIPEMVIHKNRNDSGGGSGDWYIAHKDLSGWDSSNENDRHVLKFTSAASAQQGYHRDFTDTSIRLLSNGAGGYNTSHGCIAYLFASLDGVSKVGSVTHSGTTNVDCGFSAGSRFVLLKRTDASGDWYIWDSTRGIVSGNDPYLLLNTTGAEVTNTDYIDPLSSGFTITSSLTAGTYIFYAIA
jgi:hypothetical protein